MHYCLGGDFFDLEESWELGAGEGLLPSPLAGDEDEEDEADDAAGVLAAEGELEAAESLLAALLYPSLL
jgi:hypothetical protein